ncbi:hypothetical protein ACHAQH_003009 [Verticillium albo-atrum]
MKVLTLTLLSLTALFQPTCAVPQLVLPPAPVTGCLSAIIDLNNDITTRDPSAAANSIPTQPPGACRAVGYDDVLHLPYLPEDVGKVLGEIVEAIAG